MSTQSGNQPTTGHSDYLTAVFTAPTCAALCGLQAELLQAGQVPNAPVMQLLTHFFNFINTLSASMSARQYSHLATLLDIGAVGGVAIQNLIDTEDASSLWKRLLLGGLGEGLMVLASRQYVKAFEAEIIGVMRESYWILYQSLWTLSQALQPELPPDKRRQLLDTLLNPIQDPAIDNTVKAVLIGRLYQILLAVQLAHARVS